MNDQPEFDFDAAPKKTAAEVSADLLARIKKLLRLSESPNPHEAASAMAQAMKLADRHNLDLSSLDADEEVAPIIHRWFPLGGRITFETKLAVAIVKHYFNVTPCYSGGRRGMPAKVVLVGTDMDIAIADYVLHFLLRAFRDSLRQYELAEKKARRRASASKRYSFRCGFYYGIARQLEADREALILEDSKFAIVLRDQAEAREKEMNNVAPERSAMPIRKQRRVISAIECGFEEGKKTRINVALGTSGSMPMLEV